MYCAPKGKPNTHPPRQIKERSKATDPIVIDLTDDDDDGFVDYSTSHGHR